MVLLRCPKFPRCLTADAGNFDRGHSLISLHPPPAALDLLPSPRRSVLHCTPCKKPCHCEPVTDVTGVAIRTPRENSQAIRRGRALPRPSRSCTVPSRQGTRALPYKNNGCRTAPMCAAVQRTPCKPCHCEPVRALVWRSVISPRPQKAPRLPDGIPSGKRGFYFFERSSFRLTGPGKPPECRRCCPRHRCRR